MTSQIILGNFNGVVVASDSASYLRDTKAVSHGNHKIVDLGDNHRVVVASHHLFDTATGLRVSTATSSRRR